MRAVGSLILGLILLYFPAPAIAQTYSITDLGASLPSGSSSFAYAINNNSTQVQIVGSYTTSAGLQQAFLYTVTNPSTGAGTMTTLTSLGGATPTNTAAFGINDSGVVVGYSYTKTSGGASQAV